MKRVRNIGLSFCYAVSRRTNNCLHRDIETKGDSNMKGYTVESGYMGFVNGIYMLFASEMDYIDYMQ